MKKLDDKAKIRLLEASIVVMGCSMISMYLGADMAMRAMEEQMKKNRKLAALNNKVVKRFAELAPLEVSKKIMEEFEFDLVTLDLDDPEIPTGERHE